MPLALAAAWAVVRHVPTIVHEVGEEGRGRVLNATVAAAALVAGLTFAVMIGTFYLAEQYLQKTVALLGARRQRGAGRGRAAGRRRRAAGGRARRHAR